MTSGRTLFGAVAASVAAVFFTTVPSLSQSARGLAVSPGLQCRSAISIAEQGMKLPGHLLAAIGRVESGRYDPQTGVVYPWPWTINVEGEGSFFDTKDQAIAAVRLLLAHGVKSIDVGCMQVNLMYHPNAFATLDQAFDPPANAHYAAQFLGELFVRTNDWTQAAALYHSATPELAADYRRRVLAAWPVENRVPDVPARDKLADAWAATLGVRPKAHLPVRPAASVANLRATERPVLQIGSLRDAGGPKVRL